MPLSQQHRPALAAILVAVVAVLFATLAGSPAKAAAPPSNPILDRALLDLGSYQGECWTWMKEVVFDATGPELVKEPPPRDVVDPARLDRRIVGFKLLEGGFLVVVVHQEPREVLDTLVKHEALGPIRMIAAVSEDVRLDDAENLMWGIFTRFDPARDMVFTEQRFIGARPVYRGRVGIDATWKTGYPLPLEMPDDLVKRVELRWEEYFR